MSQVRLWADRLAAALARRPLRVAGAGLLLCALTATGLFRFSVDAGQSLLVGSTSDAGTTYARFAQAFGSDPIVIVFSTAYGGSAGNSLAPYIERNLERMGALEIDLTFDKRVQSVLGPGTVAGSLEEAAVSEVGKVVAEYPYFVAETELFGQAAALQQQLQQGKITQAQYTSQVQALSNQLQNNVTVARAALDVAVIKAAEDAHNARAQYTPKPGDLIIDSRERAVDAAVAKDAPPPGWAQYLAGPLQPTNEAAAEQLFERVTAAFGDCDPQIASILKLSPSCQVFFERTLLDLPHCPPVNSARFCLPKAEWAAVLPPPVAGGPAYMAVSIRLKPQYATDRSAIDSLIAKIDRDLTRGASSDPNSTLTASRLSSIRTLGRLAPTQCGGQTQQNDPTCNSAFHDTPLLYTIAGAPLLGEGVVDAMSGLLVVLFPVAVLVMLILLVAVFRVRGRWWPLLAALAATVATVGIALLTGTPITPAVLAGVPVLLGLGVDYSVQLVARYAEERDGGADEVTALRAVLRNTGAATAIAACATLAALIALALLAGVDWGPLVAVPLVAELALVLCGGVALAWLSGLFIALPLAVWSGRRSEARGEPAAGPVSPPPALRTLAIADNWRGIVVPLGFLAVAGWFALHVVPVQTDPQQLLASSLSQLRDIETVQQELGFTNEIDVYLRGNVAGGALDQATGTPKSVEWQCSTARDILAAHPSAVAEASSIADLFIGSSASTTASTAPGCVAAPAATPSPSPSPSSPTPSPGSSPTPASATSSPTALREQGAGAVPVARHVHEDAASTGTPSPSAAPSASAVPSPSASASPSPSTGVKINQTTFLCELRLFPLLSRTLVAPISPTAAPCPAVDEYQQRFFTADTGPISPDAARIALGVDASTVATQAALVDELRGEVAGAPDGITATPTGLAVLATTAYDNLAGSAYLLNLAPLLIVALALLLIHRNPRRALLPLLPTVLAAGWAPLILLALGRLPGSVGATLGSLNPLTVVLGALVIALGTEFAVVLLNRFYEERGRGLDPDAAAAAALHGVGRAIRVSALTLGAGFAVLALSGLLPFVNSLPLVADFGLAVVIDLGLAVAAVFVVMLPLAVALERREPLAMQPATVAVEAVSAVPLAWDDASTPAAADDEELAQAKPAEEAPPPARSRRPRAKRPKAPAGEAPEVPATDQPEATPAPATDGAARPAKRVPGVSGRRRAARGDDEPEPAPDDEPKRRPGVSGRRPRPRGEGR